ncbi:MAG: hypothetical protein KIC94_16840 [Clostridiales bacterium]|nr:hypothetical protein [Clostridiales bacterium]
MRLFFKHVCILTVQDDNQTYTALDSDFQQDIDLSVNNELSNGVELNQILDDIIN